MKIPKKFKALYDIELNDIDKPDYLILTYSVCILDEDSCGWQGWIIEGVFKKSKKKFPTGTGDKILNADYSQKCPNCDKTLFRTSASLKMSA